MALLMLSTSNSATSTLLAAKDTISLSFLGVNFDELLLTGIILLLSFVLTLFLTKKWIHSANASTLVGKDMNKPDKPLVPRSGGIVVAVVICFSLLSYIFLKTFSLLGIPSANVIEVFAISATVLLAGFIGFIDDVLGWKDGLGQLQKVLLTIPIALPLTVINAGQSIIQLPFIGTIDLGMLYPLLMVPIGIIGGTNGFNMLAGLNGLEAAMGLEFFVVFGFTGLIVGRLWIAFIAFTVAACLLAFLVFNWYPAKIFPGNSFTYSIGALIATIAILGNMERIGLWLFILYYLKFALYLRGRFIDKMGDVQAFAKPNEDGSLELPYEHIYDVTHLSIWILKKLKAKVYERDVVVFILAVQALIAISGMLLLL
jgi:UDP-N-acetylglucosamine--dolichyl-phosphate N-acetylglucosaminephosphotransferase